MDWVESSQRKVAHSQLWDRQRQRLCTFADATSYRVRHISCLLNSSQPLEKHSLSLHFTPEWQFISEVHQSRSIFSITTLIFYHFFTVSFQAKNLRSCFTNPSQHRFPHLSDWLHGLSGHRRRSGWNSGGTHGEGRKWVGAEWVEYGEGCPLSSRLGVWGSVVIFGVFWRPRNALIWQNLRETICNSDPYSKLWGDLSPRDLRPCIWLFFGFLLLIGYFGRSAYSRGIDYDNVYLSDRPSLRLSH